MTSSILGVRSARTVYNLADAILAEPDRRGPDGAVRDVLPAFERALRHEGLGAIRRTWLCLLLLDYWPLLAGPARRRFWRLEAADRERCFAKLESAPGLGVLARQLERRLLDAAADQSTDGA
ncbi:MAG: hypothetical protein QNK05_10095 [Myxococcota bacterium]|nr:hypothetical protein [Myxococcota bacterium]